MVPVQTVIFEAASYKPRIIDMALNLGHFDDFRLRHNILLVRMLVKTSKVIADHEAAAE